MPGRTGRTLWPTSGSPLKEGKDLDEVLVLVYLAVGDLTQ